MQNNRRLFIIGAGNLGRELESWLKLVPESQRDWELAGFLHNTQNGNPLNDYPSDLKIWGDWETFDYRPDDCCLIGVADVDWREKIFKTLNNKVTFLPFVAPSAIIAKFTIIPDGTIICPNCIISTNIEMGAGCFFNVGTQVGHDVRIGEFSALMASVDIGGHCIIGKKVFMGSKTVVLPKRKVADNAIIGAGSVVLRNVKEGKTVFGNPAKEI